MDSECRRRIWRPGLRSDRAFYRSTQDRSRQQPGCRSTVWARGCRRYCESTQRDRTVLLVNGTTRPLTIGTPIHQGDVIQTAGRWRCGRRIPRPEQFSISQNAILKIDEYVYDPNPDSGDNNFSMLRSLFVYTSGLLGHDDPDNVTIHQPGGTLGIRGDASDFTDIDPSTLHKAAEILDGSPVKLYTAVSTPSTKFSLKFKYGFFDPSQTLNIVLDGKSIFSTTAAADGINELMMLRCPSPSIAAGSFHGRTGLRFRWGPRHRVYADRRKHSWNGQR